MSSQVCAPPGWAVLARSRVGLEIKMFVRDRQQLIFSFLYPVIMLIIFGSVFQGQQVGTGVSRVQYFMAGIVATAVMLSSFQNLGISIPVERDGGELARLQNLGLPPVSYFAGKVGQVIALTVTQLVALIAVGRVVFDVPLPDDATKWLTLAWATILGTTAGTVLGVAVAALPARARSAGAVVAPIALVLQFFSGVFFIYSELPSWMRDVAALFPLKWLTQAMRSVFLPNYAQHAEVAHSWQLGTCLLILAAWTILGTLLAVHTFSWRPRQ